MIVTVVAVWMMQVAGHQIIRVITVRNGGVTAGRVMGVAGRMFVVTVAGCALIRIRSADGDGVFVGVRTMRVMQMAVVGVVHVAVVVHREVAATRAVRVLMTAVGSVMRRARSGN